jgi:hypothetical protein
MKERDFIKTRNLRCGGKTTAFSAEPHSWIQAYRTSSVSECLAPIDRQHGACHIR